MANNFIANYEAIGKEFIRVYYQLWDGDSETQLALENLYSENDPLMTFEGLQIMGRANIKDKITNIPVGEKMKHFVKTLDIQPTIDGGVMITVLGQLKMDDDPEQTFYQTLLLKQDGERFYVQNDVFRLNVE